LLFKTMFSADVIFEPNRTIKFKSKIIKSYFGCNENNEHHQIPLMGVLIKKDYQEQVLTRWELCVSYRLIKIYLPNLAHKENFMIKIMDQVL